MAKKKKDKKKVDSTPEQLAKEHNILDEESIKKLQEPYKAKDQEEWKRIRQKQIDLKNSEAYDGKSFFIPNEAVINIPISGTFKIAIQDALNWTLSKLEKDEIVRAMLNIQTNFEGLKDPKQIQPQDMVVWTLMSLLAEINFQAQEQGKLIYTDEKVGDQITDFIEKVESDPNFKITPEEIDEITKDYKKVVPGGADLLFEEEKTKKDEKSDTNED